jgi:hypothetical protein
MEPTTLIAVFVFVARIAALGLLAWGGVLAIGEARIVNRGAGRRPARPAHIGASELSI